MKWQRLKLKRLRLKPEIPDEDNLLTIINIWLSEQRFTMLQDEDDRIFFHNTSNDKWYELFNEIIEK